MGYLVFTVVVGVVLAASVLYLVVKRKIVLATVDQLTWNRSVEIQKSAWVRKRRATVPPGAENVESVCVWVTEYEPQTVRKTTVDPVTGAIRGRHVTEMAPVQKRRQYYDFDVYEPVSSRTVTASGVRRDGVYWPTFTLATDEQQKEGGRSEYYTVEFLGDDGKRYRKTLPWADWSDVCEERRYQLVVTLLCSVARFQPCTESEATAPGQP
jgi:hypothetical protein